MATEGRRDETPQEVDASRPWRRRAVAAGLGLGALLAIGASFAVLSTTVRQSGPPPSSAAQAANPQVLGVTISARAQPMPAPRSFLGLSTEYWTVPVWASHISLLDRVFALLRVDGPMVLRVGGDSADHSFWSPTRELPEWVFELTPSWLRQVSRMVTRSGTRLILDLNLVTATPQDAAQWARAAEAKLPTESIIGFEIGNEPDIYSHNSWLSTMSNGSGLRTLPRTITATSYARVFDTYAQALEKIDPGVPLMGPALAEPQQGSRWLSALLAGPHPGLTAITAHRYPYSQCSRPPARTYPTIGRVLSENATAGMARTIRSTVLRARRAGLPVRLTEINSVTCGGRRGVSDTFATALWAPDALFELLRAGVASVSVHVRANAINMAFSLTAHGLVAHPLVYGMILFARMFGPGAELVPLQVSVQRSLHLKAWAVRVGGSRLNVLLINKGRRSVRVALRLPASGPASVERMQAPSVRSTSGVTLGGQHLSADGRWQGRRRIETVVPGARGYALTIAPMSAAMLTVAPRAGAL
jgi:hypothetical protein